MNASRRGFAGSVLAAEAFVFTVAMLLLGWRIALVVASIPISILIMSVRAWPLVMKPIRHLIKTTNKSSLSQLQGYAGLASFLGTDRPLPPLTGWTLAADNALELIQIAFDNKPKTIVELGSGSSTILLATLLARQGSGRIYSLEHDKLFAAITRQKLVEAELDKWVVVLDAPLEPFSGNDGSTFHWYSESAIKKLPPRIDLLLVDGPPGREGHLSRYPALERLKDRLVRNAVVLLDDAKRTDEKEAFHRWKTENPEFECTILQTSTGLGIMRKKE